MKAPASNANLRRRRNRAQLILSSAFSIAITLVRSAPGLLGGMLFLLSAGFSMPLFAAQLPISGKITGGFQAPTSTDPQGRRHLLKGTNAVPRGNNTFEITQPRVTSFNADDTPDMFIESQSC